MVIKTSVTLCFIIQCIVPTNKYLLLMNSTETYNRIWIIQLTYPITEFFSSLLDFYILFTSMCAPVRARIVYWLLNIPLIKNILQSSDRYLSIDLCKSMTKLIYLLLEKREMWNSVLPLMNLLLLRVYVLLSHTSV